MPPALVTALLRSKLRLKPVLLLAATVKLTGTVTVVAPNPVTEVGILQTAPAAQLSRVELVLLKKKLEADEGAIWILALVYVPEGTGDKALPTNCESVWRRLNSRGGSAPATIVALVELLIRSTDKICQFREGK
jgi:hypothetical protein